MGLQPLEQTLRQTLRLSVAAPKAYGCSPRLQADVKFHVVMSKCDLLPRKELAKR